jgi:hypothetical protein
MKRPRAVRVAVALWITLAFCAWNVIFDQIIVNAGRAYVFAASVSAAQYHTYLLIDDWMRPAVNRALVTASVAAIAILAVGLLAIGAAARRDRSSAHEELPCGQ